MVVTMTTVGFGDLFAKTYLGKLISIVACFYGVFLVSLMVVTLENSSKFLGPQNKSFNSLQAHTAF